MELIDSHCHLDFENFPDPRALWQRCRQQGIKKILVPATEPQYWPRIQALCEALEGCYWAAGVHPWWAQNETIVQSPAAQLSLKAQIETALEDPHCLAIGECGLDGSRPQSEQHLAVLKLQLELACELKLPLIIHAHKAHNAILELLKHHRPPGGVIHAFSGSIELAQQYIRLGFSLGIGGSITYPRAKKTRLMASQIPLQHLVLETDAPSMPLHGQQGKDNNPLALLDIAQTLAQLRQCSLEELAKHSSSNCQRIFNFPEAV